MDFNDERDPKRMKLENYEEFFNSVLEPFPEPPSHPTTDYFHNYMSMTSSSMTSGPYKDSLPLYTSQPLQPFSFPNDTLEVELMKVEEELNALEKQYNSSPMTLDQIFQTYEKRAELERKKGLLSLSLKRTTGPIVVISRQSPYLVLEKKRKNNSAILDLKGYEITIEVLHENTLPLLISVVLYDMIERKSVELETFEVRTTRFQKKLSQITLFKNYKANKDLHQLHFMSNNQILAISKPFGIITNIKQRQEIFKNLVSTELFGEHSQISWARFRNEIQIMFLVGTVQSLFGECRVCQKPTTKEELAKLVEIIRDEINRKRAPKKGQKKSHLRRALSPAECDYLVSLVQSNFDEASNQPPPSAFDKSRFEQFWNYFGTILELLRNKSPENKEVKLAFLLHLLYGWCRNDAEKDLFADAPTGSFLLRFSSKHNGGMALWYKTAKGDTKHILLQKEFIQKNRIIKMIIDEPKPWGLKWVIVSKGIFVEKREFAGFVVSDKTDDENSSKTSDEQQPVSHYDDELDY